MDRSVAPTIGRGSLPLLSLPERHLARGHAGRKVPDGAHRAMGGVELGAQLGDSSSELGHLLLKIDYPAYAGQPETFGRQAGHLLQELDVAHRVASAPAFGTAGRDQSEPVVGAQG